MAVLALNHVPRYMLCPELLAPLCEEVIEVDRGAVFRLLGLRLVTLQFK